MYNNELVVNFNWTEMEELKTKDEVVMEQELIVQNDHFITYFSKNKIQKMNYEEQIPLEEFNKSIWIDFCNPTDLLWIQKNFEIEKDITKIDQLDSIEILSKSMIIHLQLSQDIIIIIFKDKLITIRRFKEKDELYNPLLEYFKMEENISHYLILYFYLKLLFEEINKKIKELQQLVEQRDYDILLEKIKLTKIFKHMQVDKKEIIETRIQIEILLKSLKSIMKFREIPQNDKVYFVFLFNQFQSLQDRVLFISNKLLQSHTNFMLKNELHHFQREINIDRFMKIFQLLGIIYVPFSLVCGIFTVNIRIPWQFQGPTDSLAFFYILMAILTLVSVYLILILNYTEKKPE